MMTLELTRIEVIRIRLALTHVVADFEREISDPHTSEYVKEVSQSSLKMWEAVQKQLGSGDEFSAAGVNMFMSKVMHYAQRDMTNTRCSIVLPMGFKKGGDGHGRY